MKTNLTFFLIVIPYIIFSQVTVENGELNISIIDSKKISKLFNQNSTVGVGKEGLKLMIKMDFNNNTKNDIDLNKFSLVNHKYKLRFRGSDVAITKPFKYNGPGIMLMTTKIKTASIYLQFNPEIKDHFYDYTIPEYKNIEMLTQSGLRKKDATLFYFKPIKYKIKRIQLFFILPKKIENESFELYYGIEKITSIKIRN